MTYLNPIACVVVFFATASSPVLGQQGNAAEPLRVASEQIGKDVELIGVLGRKLGKRFTISGTWHFPKKFHPKTYSLRFSVTAVDGKQLPKPVEFNVGQLKVLDGTGVSVIPPWEKHDELDGQQWTFAAYETGELNFPTNWYDENASQDIVASPYYFKTFTPMIVGRITNSLPKEKQHNRRITK